MRQGRAGDAGTRAQLANAQALGARAHQRVQHRKALFGTEGGKSRGGLLDGHLKGAILFHVSIFLETSK